MRGAFAVAIVALMGCQKVSLARQPIRTEAPSLAAADAPTPPSRPIVSIAVTGNLTCAVREDGAVTCFGEGHAPADLHQLDDAVEIVLTESVWCARTRGGRVVCEGRPGMATYGDWANLQHRAGGAHRFDLGLEGVLELRGGENHVCARTASEVRCTGVNVAECAGPSNDWRELVHVITPVGPGAQSIALGNRHSCAVQATGQVVCWGATLANRHGTPSPDRAYIEEPSSPATVVPGIDDAVEVASHAAGAQTCVRRRSGVVTCFGSRGTGRRGDPFESLGDQPVDLGARPNATKLVVTPWRVCTLESEGAVFCTTFGGGRYREWVEATAEGHVRVLASSTAHDCALRTDGTLHCRGRNDVGQLGAVSRDYHEEPVAVGGL